MNKLTIVILLILATLIGLVTSFYFSTQLTKVLVIVYLIETMSNIDLFSLKESFIALGLIIVVGLVPVMISVSETDLELEDIFTKTNYYHVKKPIIILLGIGMFGTLINSIVPHKNTSYLLAGIYVTGSAIDSCSEENTACYKIVNKLNTKAMAAIDSIDVDQSKILEVATKAISETTTEE